MGKEKRHIETMTNEIGWKKMKAQHGKIMMAETKYLIVLSGLRSWKDRQLNRFVQRYMGRISREKEIVSHKFTIIFLYYLQIDDRNNYPFKLLNYNTFEDIQ